MALDSPHNRSKAPLFERLLMTGTYPNDIVDLGTISVNDVKQSVARNLEFLLNTRIDPKDDISTHTVVNYGIPDFSAISSNNASDLRMLSIKIQRAITAFEPRLHSVRVDVIKADAKDLEQSIQIQLQALLHVEPIDENVKFFLVIQNKYGRVNVYDGE
ncbi:MAG: type VI secretion system baseplate subunit TssE [Candidatus Kapabacteria bacterium]|nr:type VI secretion system baseplate subunit TssE [Candidatus Kapabacteria bacterium]